MISGMGTLTINLNPPQIRFDSDAFQTSQSVSMVNMQLLLNRLGVQRWPLKDCVIRVTAVLSVQLPQNETQLLDAFLNVDAWSGVSHELP